MSSPQLSEDSQSASYMEATRRFNILIAVYKALSDCFAATVHNAHGSSLSPSDSNGSSFSAFLNKLALACDTRKGTDTITALVTLVGDAGQPVITLTSNYRREHEFREIGKFLQDLLHYAEANPDNLNLKPLQKQVLWRIMESCHNKMDGYLTKLIEILPPCIKDCAGANEGECGVPSLHEHNSHSRRHTKNSIIRSHETARRIAVQDKDSEKYPVLRRN